MEQNFIENFWYTMYQQSESYFLDQGSIGEKSGLKVKYGISWSLKKSGQLRDVAHDTTPFPGSVNSPNQITIRYP